MKLTSTHPDAELIAAAGAYTAARRAFCAAYAGAADADDNPEVQRLDAAERAAYQQLAAMRAVTAEGVLAMVRALATAMLPDSVLHEDLLIAALESAANLSADVRS
jgi:hypothetical protein